jgi:DNA-binding CsgD family transcriptional regulator
MGRVSTGDIRYHSLCEEIEVIRPGERATLAAPLGSLRELAELDSIVCMTAVPTTSAWLLEHFFTDNVPNPTRFRQLASGYLARSSGLAGLFDPRVPEHARRRNTLIDLAARVPPKLYEQSRIYRELLEPLRLHRDRVVRAVLYDGETAVAWFGTLHARPLTQVQYRLLSGVLPALRRRLFTERRIAEAAVVGAALRVILDRIAAAAFVVGPAGRLVEANEAGRALLTVRRADVSAALRAALSGGASPMPVELTSLDERGAPHHWLAIVRTSSDHARVVDAIARAAAELRLTRRQRDVLEQVITGKSNAAIAAALHVTDRAIEQHLTAIFDRAAVGSRAALINYVLLR